jgi:hypothetical protein
VSCQVTLELTTLSYSYSIIQVQVSYSVVVGHLKVEYRDALNPRVAGIVI